MISDGQQTIIKDHALVDSDRWELSDIFYNLRLILDERGYNTKLINDPKHRKKIQANMVTEVCDKLGIYRHDIGIFPADRAQMAFQGNTCSVSFESLNWLCSYRTDVIFIEKE
jgi:hypothetical protein